MIIVWPNSDGTITLSQRIASGNVEPDGEQYAEAVLSTYILMEGGHIVVSSPARSASLVSSSSFANSSATSMTFTMPSDSSQLTAGSTFNLMWAYSGSNPASSAVDASLRQHSGAGVFQFDLTAQYDVAGTGGESTTESTESSSGSGSSSGRNILVAHVVTGALATMLFLPLGILTPRYARGLTTKRWWFPAHSANNGVIAFALVIAAYAIGQSKFGDAQGSSPHPVGL
jgi:hypothetical protein